MQYFLNKLLFKVNETLQDIHQIGDTFFLNNILRKPPDDLKSLFLGTLLKKHGREVT